MFICKKGAAHYLTMKKNKCPHVCTIVEPAKIEKVRQLMPPEETLYSLAQFFKVFGDPTRVKIIWALAEEEMCVCDIAHLLGMGHSAISHQLRVLKQARLVKPRREGKNIYYALDDQHIEAIFKQGLAHIRE